MIKFLRVTLRNFLTYGNSPTTVELDRASTTLIVGQNLDDTGEGVGSNGVGKTTMLNAIVYALYDKPIGTIEKIDNLVNNINKKNMEVILEFFAENGNHYKIHRMRKMKTGADGNKVHFFENGKDITRTPNSDTNADIARIIGIPYDLFVRIVVFSATEDGFFSMKGNEQKAFIEELFGLTLITQRAEQLKKKIKDTKSDVDFKQTKVDQLVKEHERHATLIESAKKRVAQWKVQNEATIDDLLEQLETVKNVDFEGEAFLHAKASELKVLLQGQTTRISELGRETRTRNTAVTKVTDQLKHLKDSKCPFCLQQFDSAATKIESLESEFHELNEEIEALWAESTKLERQNTKTQKQYDEVRSLITVKNLDELVEIKNEAKNIKRRIVELEQAQNPFEEPLRELEQQELEPIDYSGLEQIRNVLDHQQFLLKLLTKNDSFVRKTLISNNLPFLNKQLKKHLVTLGLPHTVEFTEELDAKISKLGNQIDHNLLSNGQGARLDFALSIAFKDVRERLHGRTNIVFFDEVLDYGLDDIGVVACAKMLKQIALKDNISLYIISHRQEIANMFDKKLVVKMEKGFSYIEGATAPSV